MGNSSLQSSGMNKCGGNERGGRRQWMKNLWDSAESVWSHPLSNHPAPHGNSVFPWGEDLRKVPKGIQQSAWEDFVCPHKSGYPRADSLHVGPAEVEVRSLTVNTPRIWIAISFCRGAQSHRGNHRSAYINQPGYAFLNMNCSQGFWETCKDPALQKTRNRMEAKTEKQTEGDLEKRNRRPKNSNESNQRGSRKGSIHKTRAVIIFLKSHHQRTRTSSWK